MPLDLKTLQYDPARGGDVMVKVGDVHFDPSKPKTIKEAASALFDALDTYATSAGYSEGSVSLWAPDDAAKRGYGNNWMITWEDGPFEWAINFSYLCTGPWGYVEPYHGFDLTFAEK